MTHAKLFMSSMILAACATTIAEETDPAAPPDIPALEPGEAWVYVATALDGTPIRATCVADSIALFYHMECPHRREVGHDCVDVEGLPGGGGVAFAWYMGADPDWTGEPWTAHGRFGPDQDWRMSPGSVVDSTNDVYLSGGMLHGTATMTARDGSFEAMRFRVPLPGAPTEECDDH